MGNRKKLNKIQKQVDIIEQKLKIAELQLEVCRKTHGTPRNPYQAWFTTDTPNTTKPWPRFMGKEAVQGAEEMLRKLDDAYQALNPKREDKDVDL